MECKNKMMKVAIDINTNKITGFKYQSAGCEVEVKDHKFSNEEVFTKEQQSRFYVENGEVKKYSDEELKLQPEYIAYKESERKSLYVNETDGIILKAVRELLKDNTLRSKLSSETQQLLASAEMKIEQIKSEVK